MYQLIICIVLLIICAAAHGGILHYYAHKWDKYMRQGDKMNTKEMLCIKCAKRQGVNKDGYIKCPYFKTYREAKENGMNIFLHCYCSECENKGR